MRSNRPNTATIFRWTRTFTCVALLGLVASCDFRKENGSETDPGQGIGPENPSAEVVLEPGPIKSTQAVIERDSTLGQSLQGLSTDTLTTPFPDSTALLLRIHSEFVRLPKRKKFTPNRDSLFARLILELPGYLEGANQTLYEDPAYEIYSAAVYESMAQHLPAWNRFKDSLSLQGLKVESEEGVLYIREDPEFLAKFLTGLSEPMNTFGKQYLFELRNPFWADASIMVSVDEHSRRLLFWDEFTARNKDFQLYDYAFNRFEAYLYFLMFGTDNTPIYTWEEPRRVRDELIDTFTRYAENHPESQSAPLLREYLLFLEERDYKFQQSAYSEFAHQLMPSMAY